jgi:hypothetical protein
MILVFSGLFQFIVYKFFGWQVNFLDYEHYDTIQSFAHRLRGLFIEPNWYAIALAFNTILLIDKNLKAALQRHKFLLGLTIIVFVLNGSFGPLGLLALVLILELFKQNKFIAIFFAISAVVLFAGVLKMRGKIQDREGVNVLNYYSRLMPIVKVFEYMKQSSSAQVLFGYGFGSWGTLAVREELSVLVYDEDPSKRDGSELPVFLFELGLIGTFIFFFDSTVLLWSVKKGNILTKGSIFLFVSIFLLYPALKFWMYMAYYFIIRQKICSGDS